YEASGSGGGFGEAGEGPDIEGAASQDKTLRDFLYEQIHMDITDGVQLLIAEKLVDLLDDAGYLREDTRLLADTLGATRQEIDAVVARLQQMEPVGVFARSLKECLKLQLADMNRLDPVMEILLDNLEMIGRGELQSLKKKCGADDEDFAEMLADIRRCNPKPGLGFAREEPQAVIPDVIVRKGRATGRATDDMSAHWLIELNPEVLPRVLINRQYSAEVNARAGDKEVKKFVSEQMANANWLIKALDSRAQTILKVAQEIVKQQEKFLLHGIRYLKPLVLKDIALAVGMKQEFRQSQSLVMTQALQQSIKLLQLSAVELQEYIDAEIEKNPLLAREENDAGGSRDESSDEGGAVAETADGDGLGLVVDTANGEAKEITVSDSDYSVSESLNDESYANDYADE
ncbi:MAG: hypothetical protein B7X02_02790, partial [Rhodospirillales bacterium 12-54-5]